MEKETKLRSGWTTGACAAGAAASAFEALVTGAFTDPVSIDLPKGKTPCFELKNKRLENGLARASIVKDAGDDPDVTHGAEIVAEVRRLEGDEIIFKGGEGVGRVTRPGLPLAVGEPAINPGPRKIITAAIRKIAAIHGVNPGLEITLSVPGGVELAKSTLNGRLGILGGISILGTTGVVTPYSCAAWISSIHRGVDVALASGAREIAACTGSTSENALSEILKLEDWAYIDMGDFVGGLLKYLRRNPVPLLTLGGGFAKITKLAQGEMNLHSKESRVDFDFLAETLKNLGATEALCKRARQANTAMEVLEFATWEALPLASAIAVIAKNQALRAVKNKVPVQVYIFDRQGRQVGHARP